MAGLSSQSTPPPATLATTKTSPSESDTSGGMDSGYASQVTTPRKGIPESNSDSTLIHKVILPSPKIFRSKVTRLRPFNMEIPEAVQNRFYDLKQLFDKPLYEYLSKERVSVGSIAMRLKVLGKSEETAKPWVVVLCDESISKLVKQYFNQPQVKEQFQTCNTDPELPSLDILIHDKPPRSRAVIEFDGVDEYTDADTSLTLCGTVIKASRSKDSNIATLGGIVRVSYSSGISMLYGMTVGHLFTDGRSERQTSICYGAQDDSRSDTADDENSDADIIEEFILDIDFGEDHATLDAQAAITQPKPLPGSAQNSSWSRLGYGIVPMSAQCAPFAHQNLDWALVSIENKARYQPNLLPSPYNIPSVELRQLSNREACTTEKEVVVVCGRNELKRGKLSSFASFLLLAPGSTFVQTYTLTLTDGSDIRDGNSGSWVVDALSYEVYGHLVASDAFRDGYIIPLAAILRDMKTELSAESICLPTSDEVHLWHSTQSNGKETNQPLLVPSRSPMLSQSLPTNSEPRPLPTRHGSRNISDRNTPEATQARKSNITIYSSYPLEDRQHTYSSFPREGSQQTSLSHSQAGNIQGHTNTALQHHHEDLYDEPDRAPLASRDHTPTGKHAAADFLARNAVDTKAHLPVQDTKNDQQNYPPGTWNMQPRKMKPDWDKHKVAIFHLYQKEKRPLRDVMHIMIQKHSFVASIKQYKDQFKKWEMVKNLNKVDAAICLYALDDIERENRQHVVLLRGRVITRGDINIYLKKVKKREENLRAIIPRPTEWPAHITFGPSHFQIQTPPSSRGHSVLSSGLSPSHFQIQTPPSSRGHSVLSSGLSPSQLSEQTTPLNTSSSPTKLLTPRSSLSQRTSFSSRHFADSGFASEAEDDENAAEHKHYEPLDKDVPMEELDFLEEDEVSDRDKAKICTGLAESDNFRVMVRQIIAPKLLSGFEQVNPLFFSLLSTSAPAIYRQDQDIVPAGQAQASESIFAKALKYDRENREMLTRSHPSQMACWVGRGATSSVEPSVSFLRECLSACIVGGQGFRETADALIHSAVQDFRNMISRCDSYCLTALNLLIGLLESVGQRPLAEIILQKILETESDQLESESPIGATIRFLLDIVCGRARQSKYKTDRMWQVYHELCELWGADSPSALAGLYHVAWTLALVDDTNSRREAWAILEPLNVKCEVTLGPCHFQTITSMATSARVLYHLGKHWEAALMINRAIQRLDLMYEDFHPYRLEARSRQARLLMKLEGSHDVETILQDVVRRQAAVLGVQNSRTQSTLELLKHFLTSKGRSQEAYNLPEVLERISDNRSFEN